MAKTGPETQKDQGDYSVTVSSRGMVRAKPDRYLGAKYSYGSSTSKRVHKTRPVIASTIAIKAGNSSPEVIAKSILRRSTPNRVFVVTASSATEAKRAVKAMTIAQEKLLAKGYGVKVTPSKQMKEGRPKAFKLAIEQAAGK